MLRQNCFSLRLGTAALAAGALALSCGGGSERHTVAGPAPVAAQPTTADDGSGSVGEAATATTLLCHYDATTKTWSDLRVPLSAVQPHRNHGDVQGSCTVACPCFPAADESPLTCNPGETLKVSCDAYGSRFSLTIACHIGSSGSSSPLEQRITDVALKACVGFATDLSGNVTRNFYDPSLSDPEVAACKQFIVNSPYYPATCPR